MIGKTMQKKANIFLLITSLVFGDSIRDRFIYRSSSNQSPIAKLSPNHHYRMEVQDWVKIQSKDQDLSGWTKYNALRSSIEHSAGKTSYRFRSNHAKPISISHTFDRKTQSDPTETGENPTHNKTDANDPKVFNLENNDHLNPNPSLQINLDQPNQTSSHSSAKYLPDNRIAVYSESDPASKLKGHIYTNENFEAITLDWVKIIDLETQKSGWIKLSMMKKFASEYGSLSYKINSPSTDSILITFKPKSA